MSDVTEIRNILDQNFNQRCIALVCFVDTYGFNPERLFQVELNPAALSHSRRFIHLTGKAGICDVHGWYPISVIEVIEILAECNEKGEPMSSLYSQPSAELKVVGDGY